MGNEQQRRSVSDTVSQQEALHRIGSAKSLFCFLDYDGTVAPIAPTPDDALPVPGTAELLAKLAAAPQTRVAIVSGRTIASVRALLDVPGAYYVGIHGAELRRPDGTNELANGAALVASDLPLIKQRIEADLATTPGILIEDKGAAIACHYRLASRSDAVRARQIVTRIARNSQRTGLPIAVLHGHEVTEIRPAHVTKGTAVASLLAAAGPATLALYIGDDRTDAEALAALPSRSIGIHVGPSGPPPGAGLVLADPIAVHEFLRAVLSARCARTAEPTPGSVS